MSALITYGDSHLSLGTIVGLPLMIVGAILLSAAVLGFLLAMDLEVGAIVGGVLTLVLSVVGIAVGMYPYSGQYHHWQEISGKVTSTNSRFLSVNKGTDQKFVVTFDGSDQQFGCSDTRCAGVQVGDELSLTCKRVWQWFGTPGYDCNFVSYKPAAVS